MTFFHTLRSSLSSDINFAFPDLWIYNLIPLGLSQYQFSVLSIVMHKHVIWHTGGPQRPLPEWLLEKRWSQFQVCIVSTTCPGFKQKLICIYTPKFISLVTNLQTQNPIWQRFSAALNCGLSFRQTHLSCIPSQLPEASYWPGSWMLWILPAHSPWNLFA